MSPAASGRSRTRPPSRAGSTRTTSRSSRSSSSTTRAATCEPAALPGGTLPGALLAVGGCGENAAACLAAAVGKALPDLPGGHGHTASGTVRPGRPRAGCPVLAADAATLHALCEKAAAKDGPLRRRHAGARTFPPREVPCARCRCTG
ncbi:DUF2000 family protein [Streptomyces sp. NPDC005283]|uniref:DUF2000 family protein n=1 Tax=Streptomyces sp. NPDC005283 TaxID=3156871 RepID=UPI0034566756